METIEVFKLRENPELAMQAAQWYSIKWNIPVEAYYDSILECMGQKSKVPQWYIVIDDNGKIIAGAGIIENDFHDRKDLSPNVCALFVEEEWRRQGIARYILDFVRKDMCGMGVEKLYLVTDHTKFYETCGWEFLTIVNDDEGNTERLYTAATL